MSQNFTNLTLAYDVLEPVQAPVNPHRNVGKLIDITDETDKQDINLTGSDLDNIKKKEFDLVDLYQNIYVTPQHVRKEDKIESLYLDCNEFFQKLEAGERIEPSTSLADLKNSSSQLSMVDEIDSRCKELYVNDGKSVEKTFNEAIFNNHDTIRELKVPNIDDLKYEVDNMEKKIENSFNPMRKRLDINGNTRNTDKQTSDSFKGSLSTNIATANHSTKPCTIDSTINNVITKSFKQININTASHQIPIENRLIQQNIGTANIYNNSSSKANSGLVLTVTLDKKTYNKQRRVKNEKEKAGYTKGPELYEKSIVLPQIMKRLADREEALQKKVGFRRRLILDSGQRQTECQCKMSNIPLNTSINDKKKLTEQHTFKEMNPSTNKPISSRYNNVKLTPVVALENCNRERLIAHRVNSAFEKFVLTGSYY